MKSKMVKIILEEAKLIIASSIIIFLLLVDAFLLGSTFTIIDNDKVTYLPKGSIVMSHDQECSMYIKEILKFEEHAITIENDIERASYSILKWSWDKDSVWIYKKNKGFGVSKKDIELLNSKL